MWDEFARAGVPSRHVLTIGTESVGEVVDLILTTRAAGELRFTVPTGSGCASSLTTRCSWSPPTTTTMRDPDRDPARTPRRDGPGTEERAPQERRRCLRTPPPPPRPRGTPNTAPHPA